MANVAHKPAPWWLQKDRATTDVRDALENLVNVIDAAGLLNLSRGVQLGPTVWYVKASDALEFAKVALAKTESRHG